MRLSRRPRANPSGEMSILEHIGELRSRLLKSCIALVVATTVAFAFLYEPVIQFLLRSYCSLPASVRIGTVAEDGGCRLAALSPLEPLSIRIRVSLTVGLLLAMPFLAYQLWRFITPGLRQNEKRFAIPFVMLGTIFFVAGAAFSHYIAFPYTWKFFLGFETQYLEFRPKISDVFSLWVKMLLAFGAIFQMPTIVFFLARMGMVTAGFLIKHTKYAVLIIFILGAVLSPGTDVISQAMMAGPMLVLYALSIVIAWMFAKRKPAE